MSAPYDRIITVDAETRWSRADYTLSKMTNEEYQAKLKENELKESKQFLND